MGTEARCWIVCAWSSTIGFLHAKSCPASPRRLRRTPLTTVATPVRSPSGHPASGDTHHVRPRQIPVTPNRDLHPGAPLCKNGVPSVLTLQHAKELQVSNFALDCQSRVL